MEIINKVLKNQNKQEEFQWQALNRICEVKNLINKSHYVFVIILSLLLVSCEGDGKSKEIIDLMPKTIDTFKSFLLVYIAFKFYAVLIEFILKTVWEIKITMIVNIVILAVFYILNKYSILILLLMYGIDFVLGFIYYYLRNRKTVGL